MTEWGVVTVIVALVGLIATVAAPIIKLTGTASRSSRPSAKNWRKTDV